jgi:biotin-(acetyl-CoA carboxylase) ligase
MLGEKVTVSRFSGEEFEAVALDVDEIGQLVVQIGGKENGEKLSLSAGEIRIKIFNE